MTRLAKAPIAWLNDDMPEISEGITLDTCLSEIRDIGYIGTELGGSFPQDKVQLKQTLDAYKLKLVGGWFSGGLLSHSLEKEKELLGKEIEKRLYLDSDVIVFCECTGTVQNTKKPLSSKPILSVDEMKDFAKNYEQLCIFAKSKGVTLAYHYHMGTIIQTPEELDLFLSFCGPEVKITYDTGHTFFGGADPLEILQKYYERVHHVHLKDVRTEVKEEALLQDKSFLQSVLDGVYTVPGDGNIDFKPILQFLKDKDYQGWLVVEAEQDPKKADPFTYAKQGYEYIKHLCTQI